MMEVGGRESDEIDRHGIYNHQQVSEDIIYLLRVAMTHPLP